MRAWAITDIGKARAVNEDAYCVKIDEKTREKAAFILCDGMGGANAGEVASSTAIEAFVENIVHNGTDLERQIRDSVAYANRVVYDLSQSRPEYNGMGTTLVTMLCDGKHVCIGNVGDSRAYLIRESGIQQITADHSLVSEMIRLGELTAEEAQHHPSRNVITRALGAEPAVKCDVFSLQVQPGDYVLMCSDGLTNHVSDPELFYEVFHTGHPEHACQVLTDIANNRGGQDNITIVLVSF